MTTNIATANLDDFYHLVMEDGNLHTIELARRWTTATLRITGLNMKGKARRKLAKALPEQLGSEVRRVFWLVHLHEPALPAFDFQRQVARRAGVTDGQFARQPILAIFRQLKQIIDSELLEEVRDALPSAVGELWEQA